MYVELTKLIYVNNYITEKAATKRRKLYFLIKEIKKIFFFSVNSTEKIFNTNFVLDGEGVLRATYNKGIFLAWILPGDSIMIGYLPSVRLQYCKEY
jgi:hypothetical protein